MGSSDIKEETNSTSGNDDETVTSSDEGEDKNDKVKSSSRDGDIDEETNSISDDNEKTSTSDEGKNKNDKIKSKDRDKKENIKVLVCEDI